MIQHLSDPEKAFLFPKDRKIVLVLKSYMWIIFICIILVPIVAAWVQYLFWGLPSDPSAHFALLTSSDPTGFPAWLRISHWVNFLFLTLIIRSGLSILFDHPRLYFNNGCQPPTDWLRFTPVIIPPHKKWTSKEDSRYLSPVIGLPGYRHTVGLARSWHFLTVPFFILNGIIFIVLLFVTTQWERLVPTSWQIIPDAWKVFVHYVTFNFPIEPNGFFHYNALQQIAYFAVVFVMAPLAILTGLAMSPAIDNRFHFYTRIFGNRQVARSLHFMIMILYVAFIIVHVSLVAATGLSLNMNHIVMGTDTRGPEGLYIGIAIILFVTFCCYLALWISWHRSRGLQIAQRNLNETLWKGSMNLLNPRSYPDQEDVSPYFWTNGKIPESEKWEELAKDNFKEYKLKIGGLVENPRSFSLDELKELASEETVTMHHCIQGWSGIAQWRGIPLKKIIEIVKPLPQVTTVAFFSFGTSLYGGTYYDTHSLENCRKPDAILAWEMNHQPLPVEHGAPLRLRIENQLGYKMVKWIETIEFVETYKTLGKGFGGSNEDDEYYDLLADI